MFLDAEAVTEEKDGEEVKYLSATNATGVGGAGKRARLTGRMNEKITQDGGLLIGSDNIIASLRSTGLSMVTIDTDKGEDMPDNVKPLTDPSRKPPPEGRLVHYDEEIEQAKEVRTETTNTIKTALQDVAEGKEMDVEKVQEAGGVISESILRNVDAMVSLTRIKKHDPYTAMHCMNVCTLVTAMAMHDGTDPGMLPRSPPPCSCTMWAKRVSRWRFSISRGALSRTSCRRCANMPPIAVILCAKTARSARNRSRSPSSTMR